MLGQFETDEGVLSRITDLLTKLHINASTSYMVKSMHNLLSEAIMYLTVHSEILLSCLLYITKLSTVTSCYWSQ